jgi:hypothetical protein
MEKRRTRLKNAATVGMNFEKVCKMPGKPA